MSAAIVQQQTNNTSMYFECGDLFSSANTQSEKTHSLLNNNRVTTASSVAAASSATNTTSTTNLQDLNINLDSPSGGSSNSLELQDSLDNSRESLHINSHAPLTATASLHRNHADQFRFHNALTRTISQPQPQQHLQHNQQHHGHHQQQQQQQQTQEPIAANLVTNLIENMGSMNLHRKLERTQSEPLPQQQVNASRYKTELCRPFEEAGECKYGEKCQFAHGYHELRNLQRHPKYKTEYCRTFHSVGFCPYGPRCHFVHNQDEARALQQQQQAQQQQQLQQQQQQQQGQTNNFKNAAGAGNHSLPLSPPLSMSTGSDRESPTGSLSLSPTSSMTSFQFGDQISPSNSVFQSAFSYVSTPPESPNAPMSPVNTPPPSLILGGGVQTQSSQIYIKPVTIQGKQLLTKSSSSPIAIIRNGNNNNNTNNNNNNNDSKTSPTKVNSVSSLTSEEARLPVFNRLSSAIDQFPSNVAL